MVGHISFGIYKGIEHEDSTEHVQWIDTIGHESLETVDFVFLWRAPISRIE